MIKNFETVKSQLNELASVINAFKSEAVQLRIVELVLGATQENGADDDLGGGTQITKRTSSRKKRRAQKASESTDVKKMKSASGTGAVSTLTQLAETNFFDKARTINDIIEHCKHALARNFKANEFSGKLGRMVRLKELTRVKNADNQYEYKKP